MSASVAMVHNIPELIVSQEVSLPPLSKEGIEFVKTESLGPVVKGSRAQNWDPIMINPVMYLVYCHIV